MSLPLDYTWFNESGWCFRDVNFWKSSDDIELTIKNLKYHIQNWILSPRERWAWAVLKNFIKFNLNSPNEICISYWSFLWSLFWTSWVQVMFPLDYESINWRISPSKQNALLHQISVIKDSIEISKRQVKAILLLTRKEELIKTVCKIWEEFNLPVYSG